MAFNVSPNVNVSKSNLTSFSKNVSNVVSGFVGRFEWGPTGSNVQISNENELYKTFGPPTTSTGGMDWWVAANFLSYGNPLLVRRCSTYANSCSVGGAGGFSGGTADGYSTGGTAAIVSKYSGELGNQLRVVVIGASGYTSGPSASAWGTTYGIFNNNNYGYVPSTTAFAEARGSSGDEMHIAILSGDVDTALGNKDEVLETHIGLSRFINAKGIDGTNIYYKDVINNNSQYIKFNSEIFTDSDTSLSDIPENNSGVTLSDWSMQYLNGYGTIAGGLTAAGITGNVAITFLNGGSVGTSFAGRSADYVTGFGDADTQDVDILVTGVNDHDDNVAVAGVAADRKDCIGFGTAYVGVTGFTLNNVSTSTSTVADAKSARDEFQSSNSYMSLDSGYKYTYDNRNDIGRWIPLNGDVAGIVAKTSTTNDPWWSPAGLNRGRINNIIKLSLNPTRQERDELYGSQINPVVIFQGEGAVLFGDKTLESRPSAFDRIQIRRLFNALEKQIATAAKLQLFEFNDAFTQQSFKNLIEPFLRNVQARRGIESFSVTCDITNNPSDVAEQGRFVADIFIKPLNSITVIQLNFTAQSNTAVFNENVLSSRVNSDEFTSF